jgi:hypothetical protein
MTAKKRGSTATPSSRVVRWLRQELRVSDAREVLRLWTGHRTGCRRVAVAAAEAVRAPTAAQSSALESPLSDAMLGPAAGTPARAGVPPLDHARDVGLHGRTGLG